MGLVFVFFYIQWVNAVPKVPYVAFLTIVFYSGLYFGVFGLLYAFIVRRTRWPKVFVTPILWVAIEYLRSNLSFLAIPLGLLGHSQYNNIPIIQIASFTSVYGVSFLVVLVNISLAEGIVFALSHWRKINDHKYSAGKVVFPLATTSAIVLIILLWGSYEVRSLDNNRKTILTTSLIQGNIPQDEKWDANFRKKIIDRYQDLTLKASQGNTDLIIWPETATPGYIQYDLKVYLFVRDLVRETGIPILLGSSSQAKVIRGEKKKYKPVNSAFLVDETGRIVLGYNKIKLLPFAEYLPFEEWFPWPRWLVPGHDNYMAGKYPTIFSLPKGRFGVVICWENLFPDLFRRFVDKGAQFMVNLTNEAWFGKTAASQQLLTISVFRAVENRVSLLRAANTGISSLIDPMGRIKARVMDEKGNDIFVTGILTVPVPEPMGPTFYTKHGDVFAKVCTIAVVFFIISALLPVRILQSLKISRSG
jgi:apolipoprotein N-acyltransferase